MGLLSIFKRRADSASTSAAGVNEPADTVQRARTRARQRLIGAIVLVGVGVIGFPLVFETQPRPIPVDIPIEVPRKESAPALVMPVGRAPGAAPAASTVTPPIAAVAASAAVAPSAVITESREDAGREVSVATPVASAAKGEPKLAAATVAAVAAAAVAAPKPAAEPKQAGASAESARAKALLNGKPVAHAEAGRFVVQVGAFADAGAARETRLKVEKLGLKTYTQVASTAAGNRIRVRVGPFGTREEADKAMAKARSAGLAAVVLTL